MDLMTCRLSPAALAALYGALRDRLALRDFDVLNHRLDEAGLDGAWIDDAISVYEAMWTADLAERRAGQTLTTWQLLESEHAQLASWILAGARHTGDPSLFETETDRRTGEFYAAASYPERPIEGRAVVTAWTVGYVPTLYERRFPAVPAFSPSDPDVALAYSGFVEHLVQLLELDDPLPELIGTSVVWRIGGIADALDPRYPRSMQASFDALLYRLSGLMPEVERSSIRAGCKSLAEDRNALTHLRSDNGGPSFATTAPSYRSLTPMRMAISAITGFIFETVTSEQADADLRTVQQIVASVGYDLDGARAGLGL